MERERRTVEADLGPVRADNETVLRWFILVVALLLDPAAVLLLLAADPEAMNRSQGTKQHERDRLVETQAEQPTGVGRVIQCEAER